MARTLVDGRVPATRDAFFAAAPADLTALPELSVELGDLRLANPVMPASGCFGPELSPLLPVAELGAVVTKTVFAARRSGNPGPRLTERDGVMLNSVGIPSPGVPRFRAAILPRYRACGVPVVVSVGGLTVEDYWQAVDELGEDGIAALELNVSCPNLEQGGIAIGAHPGQVERVVRGVRERTTLPVLVKLTPSAGSIGDVARAAEQVGATAVTVCNTFPGMAIDLDRVRPALGSVTGGVSGPGIKPLALRLVWQTARAVTIPVVGCGGIATAADALEFLAAGARAVQVGTATFGRPFAMAEIVRELAARCTGAGVSGVDGLLGTVGALGAV